MLILKSLLGVCFQMAVFAVSLMLPAGTWYWPRALAFLGAYGAICIIAVLAMGRWSPASLEARLEKPMSSEQPTADKIATGGIMLSFLAWFVFIPIDRFHLFIIPAPPMAVTIIGGFAGTAGLIMMLVAMYQNSFAIPVVKDQADRGQVLVDSGLYRVIRHPLYTGVLLFMSGLALWLESYISVVTALAVLVSLVARILIEERALVEGLEGYSEYMKRVRYRLVPFFW